MTELRKRIIDCLQVRGLSECTQEAYVRAERQLAEHYHKSPDLISEAELHQYFLFLKNVKHYSRNRRGHAGCPVGCSAMTVAICWLKFFFAQTLPQQWTTFKIVRPAPEKKLPVILSGAEVRQLLARLRVRSQASGALAREVNPLHGSVGMCSDPFY